MNQQHELIELVRPIILQVSEKPLPDLAPETSLAEIGIDSVSVAEIVTRIEDLFQIEVPASEWMRASTLQDFINAIERARQVQATRTLSALGADSIALGRLRHRIESDLGVDMSRSVLTPTEGIAQHVVSQLDLNPDPLAEQCELRIVANFTTEPVEETLSFWLRSLGIVPQIYFAPYNQVLQQLFDPRSLLNSSRDGYRIVLVRLEDWLYYMPETGRYTDDRSAALSDIVDRFIDALEQASRYGPSLIVGLCPEKTCLVAEPQYERIYLACARIPGIRLADFRATGKVYKVARIFSEYGRQEGHIPFTPPFFAALGTALVRLIMATRRTPIKVAVTDCDNTLWSGECGELGPENVAVPPPFFEFQHRLLELRKRGILLCLCSKNDERSVLDVFQRNPALKIRLDDVIARRINWRPKSENLIAIADELGLALDTFLFIDDSPSERAEVRARCPGVVVPEPPLNPSDWSQFLDHFWALDAPVKTDADANRTEQYRQEATRKRLRKQFGSLASFLAHLQLSVRNSPVTACEVARVSQLTFRTSQFNATGAPHDENEVARWIRDGLMICEAVCVSDRYGDYGLVGMLRMRLDVERRTATIEDFVLSCRALGKRVEHEMLKRALEIARGFALSRIRVLLRATERNGPARDFFTSFCGPCVTTDGAVMVYDTVVSELEFRLRDSHRQAYMSPLEASTDPGPHTSSAKRESVDWLSHVARELNNADAILSAVRSKHSLVRLQPYVAPTTTVERWVATSWAWILRVGTVGLHDNFFQLGGDSLKLAEFVSSVYDTFGVAVSLTLLTDPHVEATARLIELLKNGGHIDPPRPERQMVHDLRLHPGIVLDGLPSHPETAERILLTGSNGFLGSALLGELVRQTSAEIICLIRSKNGTQAEERLHRTLTEHASSGEVQGRVRIVQGDLAEARFGMSDDGYSELAREVDAIIHCGAWVNFIYDYATLKRVNVDSVEEVLKLATTKKLKRVHFISTLGMLMSARRPQDRRVFEDEHPGFELGLPNGYEQSKWVADGVARLAAARGLPVVVYRPGMLVGDAQTGFSAKTTEFASCMIKGCIQLGYAPDADTELELVPLDFAARLMVEIFKRTDSVGRVFHIRHPRPIRMPEMLEVLRRTGYAVDSVPFGEWKRRLLALGPKLQGNALFPFINFLHQLEERHLHMPAIDNANTVHVLAQSGIEVTQMDVVIERMLLHFQQIGFLERTPGRQ